MEYSISCTVLDIFYFCFLLGGVDYNELTRVSVIFMPGVNTQTVTLTTLPDVPVEEDEDLGATLTATDGRVGVFAAEATVTITDEGMCHVSSLLLCEILLWSKMPRNSNYCNAYNHLPCGYVHI